jgi:hypothetical protein
MLLNETVPCWVVDITVDVSVALAFSFPFAMFAFQVMH